MANGPALPPQLPVPDQNGRRIGEGGPVAPGAKGPAAAKAGTTAEPGAIANGVPAAEAAPAPAIASGTAAAPTVFAQRPSGEPNPTQTMAKLRAPALPPLPVDRDPVRYTPAPQFSAIVAGKATLSIGDKGPSVRTLQELLNRSGVADPKLDVDGFLGPKTMAALRKFQERERAAGNNPGTSGTFSVETMDELTRRMAPKEVEALAQYHVTAYNLTRTGRATYAELTDERIRQAVAGEDFEPENNKVGAYTLVSQSDSRATLGNGPSTISRAGCRLAGYATLASGITGKTVSIVEANDKLKAARAFTGDDIVAGNRPAAALGMREVERFSVALGAKKGAKLDFAGRIDDHLATEGRGILLGVRYPKTNEDGTTTMHRHFITILGKNPDGTYDAGETAGGQRITLSIADDGSITGRGWMIGTRYTAVDATVLAKA